MDVVEEAWASVRKNGGSLGIDGTTIKELNNTGIEPLLHVILSELRAKTYNPSPLRKVYIPKSNGKKRGLAIPTIKDRKV